MFIFTYAINYQAKILEKENKSIKVQLLEYTKIKEGKKLLSEDFDIKIIKQYNLTPKEILILKGISEGKINKEIADEINLSVNTVKYHIKNIYGKLEINSRQEARQKYFSVFG